MEVTFTTWPLPREIIPGRNARVAKKAAKYGAAIIWTASAGEVSSTNSPVTTTTRPRTRIGPPAVE